MEQALFISKIENLKYYNNKYDRLYFGNEFCERLIPVKNEIKKVLDFAKEKKIGFTFVTPYVTDVGISRLKPLLLYLSKFDKRVEVVINSYGMLDIVNKFRLMPVIGRLLVKQKKGPRIVNINKYLSALAIQRFKQTNITTIVEKFLKKNKVQRIELDNPLQGIDLNLNLIKASLYYPYCYVSTSRFCMANGCEESEKREALGVFPCKKECQRYTFELRHRQMPVPLLLKGNTHFFENNKLPANMKKMGIDRLVCQPEIPF